MKTLLDVYCGNIHVGILRLNQQRYFEFEYVKSWLESPLAYPLSILLPLKPILYSDESVRPFFENLLPEADIRRIIAQKFGLSEKNIFGILECIGGECAGAVSLVAHNHTLFQQGTYELLNEDALDNLVNKLPKHPLLADKHLRLSLAGAQHKLPVYIKNNQFYLPKDGNPSSHIVKIPIARFPNTIINEFFCMTLAQQLGLPIPNVSIFKHKQSLYIIERYDRQLDIEDHIIRLHQEDFCQASGILSEQKYESEGGPSLQTCFNLIKTHSIDPGINILNVLRWTIFNFIIGNADAHGKNLSFILTKEGPKLAPFYDILCTHIYPELDQRYAMKIGGENRPQWIQKRHWERFCESVNIKFGLILTTMEEIIGNYTEAVSKTMQKMDFLEEKEETFISNILELAEKRINQLNSIILKSK